jgi:hypothetical protein
LSFRACKLRSYFSRISRSRPLWSFCAEAASGIGFVIVDSSSRLFPIAADRGDSRVVAARARGELGPPPPSRGEGWPSRWSGIPGKGELSLAPTASRLIAVEVEPDLKKMRLLDRFSKVGFTSALSVLVEEEEELLLLLSVTMASFSFSFPLWLSAPSCFSLPPCFSSQRRCSMRSMTSALAAGDDSGSKGGSSLWRGVA